MLSAKNCDYWVKVGYWYTCMSKDEYNSFSRQLNPSWFSPLFGILIISALIFFFFIWNWKSWKIEKKP